LKPVRHVLYQGQAGNCHELTASGAALGWEVLLHHVAVHTFFHITLGFGLRKGGRLMKQLRDFWTGWLGKLAHLVKDLALPMLATAAATT
jgi:hypothetical protein